MVLADQLVKWMILAGLSLYESMVVIPGFLNIVHFQNPGGAFGMFAANNGFLLTAFFAAVTIGALGLIVYLYGKTPANQPVLTAGLALVFGGAAGNLIDRIRFGKVVDFIDVHAGAWHWPAFNLADSAITAGMCIFAFYVVFRKIPA